MCIEIQVKLFTGMFKATVSYKHACDVCVCVCVCVCARACVREKKLEANIRHKDFS